jgi:hypothetical protein
LEVLDALEEQRTLYTQEHNFRTILKAHILKTAKIQKRILEEEIYCEMD